MSKFHRTPPIVVQVAQNYKDFGIWHITCIMVLKFDKTTPLTNLTYSYIKFYKSFIYQRNIYYIIDKEFINLGCDCRTQKCGR